RPSPTPSPTGAASAAAEDVPDAGEAGGDVTLQAAQLRLVVAAPDELVGQVLLGRHSVRLVVGVDVLGAVAQPLRPGVVGVAQVERHRAGLPGLDVGDRL